ncbi:MAG: O-methyltransferase [Ferruginibacter sp.]
MKDGFIFIMLVMDALVNTLAENYAAKFSEQEDALLKEVADFTTKNHPHAHMLSGQVQGAFLSMLSRLLQPKRILEVGTFTGYSALCLAKGLTADGELHTLELREDDAATAQGFFNKSVQQQQLKLHTGDAKKIIPNLKELWDIVFIDADKPGYIEYYELILPFVKTNGIIIADNVLFHGQVLGDNISGKNALAIHAFNQHVLNDERVEQVMLTVRDGLLIARKK